MSLHGSASWPSQSELEAAGFLEPSGTALRLGYDLTGKPLFFGGDQHVFTHALPGAGKTTGAVLPTLATFTGSVVVTDPKGALTAQTAELRRQLGQRVVILNPWADELEKGFGVALGDTGFDPLAFLKSDDPAVYDNIEMVAGILCPTPPQAAEPYWCDQARTILAGCVLFLLKRDGRATLPDVFELVRQVRGKPTKDDPKPKGWTKLAVDMLASGDPALVNYAAEILSTLESEKQWSGVLGQIHNATAIYAPYKPLGRHVVKNEFDPADLKRENITVYIVIPAKRREANKPWLGLVMALCAEAVGNPGPAKPVLLLAEEYANLGYVPSILRAMAEYREAGLRCWLVVQDLNQLKRIYGRDGAQELVNLCGIRQFFRVDDLELARTLEASIGTYTARSANHSDGWSERDKTPANAARDNKNVNQSVSYSEIGVPLIRAQDILSLPANRQILLVGGKIRPILAAIVPYFFDDDLREKIAPNPYRPELPPIPVEPERRGGSSLLLCVVLSIIPAFLVGLIGLAAAKAMGMEHGRALAFGQALGWFSAAGLVLLMWWEGRRARRKPT